MTTAQPGGRYENEARKLLKELKAAGLILIVVDGTEGHGVQVAIEPGLANVNVIAKAMARTLRSVADRLEKDADPTLGHSA